MKNSIFIVVIAFLYFFTVDAQNIQYGSKMGINLSTFNGDETDGLSTRTSLHAGAIAEIRISDDFSFQPELLYSSQGTESDYSETLDGATINYSNIKLEYINIPLLAKFYVVEGLSLEAGPQIGFLITAKREFEKTDSGEMETGEEDILNEVKGMDFGLNFGLAYKLESGIFLAAHYILGLSNINDFDGSDEVKNQNNIIQFSVGYFF